MTDRQTIFGLVAHAIREWVVAGGGGMSNDASPTCVGGAYSVFYIDAARPNEIQTQGSRADRCHVWIEPADVNPGAASTELLVDVTVIHQHDGAPAITEFQVALDENLRPLVH